MLVYDIVETVSWSIIQRSLDTNFVDISAVCFGYFLINLFFFLYIICLIKLKKTYEDRIMKKIRQTNVGILSWVLLFCDYYDFVFFGSQDFCSSRPLFSTLVYINIKIQTYIVKSVLSPPREPLTYIHFNSNQRIHRSRLFRQQ